MSSHARARALSFAAASAILPGPHSAFHALHAQTDAQADDSLMHGALNSGVLCRKGPTGTRRCTKGGVSGPAEDLRPVSEVGGRGKFSAGRRCTGAGCRSTSREATRHWYRKVREGVVTHLPFTRRFLISDSRGWAGRRCIKPHCRLQVGWRPRGMRRDRLGYARARLSVSIPMANPCSGTESAQDHSQYELRPFGGVPGPSRAG